MLSKYDDVLTNVYFYFGDQKLDFQRSYDNILNILGSVGGLMDLLTFFAAIFITPIAKFIMDLALID